MQKLKKCSSVNNILLLMIFADMENFRKMKIEIHKKNIVFEREFSQAFMFLLE